MALESTAQGNVETVWRLHRCLKAATLSFASLELSSFSSTPQHPLARSPKPDIHLHQHVQQAARSVVSR